MLFKVCLLLSSVLLATGDLIDLEPESKLGEKIVGGRAIDIKEAPWQVSLLTLGSHFCGASIISEKWLLTAGHCAFSSNGHTGIRARVGSSRWVFGGSTYKVKRVIQHEKFNMITIDYDFALLELDKNITFSDKVQPVQLPTVSQEFKDNVTCFVSGWGAVRSIGLPTIRLRGVEVPIVNQKQCTDAYSGFVTVTPQMICAGYYDKGGMDACQGDSGGPLVTFDGPNKKPTLVGVVSWGNGCARPQNPGVYSRVQSVREWISINTGI